MAIPSNIVMAVVVAIATLVGFHCLLNKFPRVRAFAVKHGGYVDFGVSALYWVLSAGGSLSSQLTSALIGLGIFFYLGNQREKAEVEDEAEGIPDQRDLLLQTLTKEVAYLSEKVREQSYRWK